MHLFSSFKDYFIGLFNIIIIVFTIASANEVSDKKQTNIQPADVFLAVSVLRNELELVRFEMGKPHNNKLEIAVHNVAPREVFFQALTLFRKSNRLAFEQTRERINIPKIPQGKILSSHVLQVVNSALARIQRVKNELSIDEINRTAIRNSDKNPTDVFRTIVQANRQLDILLERRFTSADAFQQVSVAIAYTARLMSHFEGGARIAATPDYQRRKQPAKVYHRLVGIFARLQKIAQQSGVEMLTLGDIAVDDSITPSDVYDIASILVAELAYLHRKLGNVEPPQAVYFPGKKFPSHVFQRAAILEGQIIALQTRVASHPEWLRKHRTRE